MASGLDAEPQSNVATQEDDTLTPSSKSQANSLSGSTSGMERSESGLSLGSKLKSSSSSGPFTVRSPVPSPQPEGQTGLAEPLLPHLGSWDKRVSETETGTSESGQCLSGEVSLCLRRKLSEKLFVFLFWFSDASEKEGVQFSEPQKADVHNGVSRQVSQQSFGEGSQLNFPVYIYNCSFEQLKEQMVHPNPSHRPRDIFFRCVSGS